DVETRLKATLPAGHFALGVLESEKAFNALLRNDIPASVQFAASGVSIVEPAIRAGGVGSYYLRRILTHRSVVKLTAGRAQEAESDADRDIALLKPELDANQSSSHLGYAFLTYGKALQVGGKSSEALAAFQSAAANLKETVGKDHPDFLTARQLAEGN